MANVIPWFTSLGEEGGGDVLTFNGQTLTFNGQSLTFGA